MTQTNSTTSLIAFDLDGVLVPDCDQIPFIDGVEDFYGLTMYMRPIFNPEGDYTIITARPAEFRNITWTWCNKYLFPLPTTLYHERTDETGGGYKEKILNANPNIQTYVESDEGIVSYLRKNVTTGCTIIHFDQYLANHFIK